MKRGFTDKAIRELPPGFHRDPGWPTLHLLVEKSGSRRWVQRLYVGGKEIRRGLGGYPVVTLEEARDAALENRRALRRGELVRAGAAPTFGEIAGQVITMKRQGLKTGSKTEAQLSALLGTYCAPLAAMRVDRIATRDLLAVVEPVWIAKRATATKLRAFLGSVFARAVAEGHRTDNPADGVTASVLPKAKPTARHTALPHTGVSAALATIRASGAQEATKDAFALLVLTACRSGEVRGARWEEMDLDGRVWTIPQERAKSSRPHRVALSRQAVAILRTARDRTGGAGLVFPSATGRIMSDNTLSKVLRENAVAAVPHGFRSSFRDWCGETGQPRELAEAALAHTLPNETEAAYARSDLLERRRGLMQEWADYLDTKA